ncbi:MAG: 3-dehydroquinate synthase [Bacteroidales bacterium]|jgi:3-dehydroquinate synthase|nr:3-dehydroquinate synthase [Bacteroidales bacterium]
MNFNDFSQKVILSDENTRKYCLPVLLKHLGENKEVFHIIEIKSGEESKNIESYRQIINQLIDLQIDRNTLLINLGGGVVCDIGGFVAATYKRGIRFINVPTTLLAMVDAAHGGKNGIDFQGIKNTIGCFHLPEEVIINVDFLNTLSPEQIESGRGEIAKIAIIAGKMDGFNGEMPMKNVIAKMVESKQLMLDIINFAISEKMKIVNEDPLEENGKRMILNFGHTFGHCYESYFLRQNKPIPHGIAVVAGMIDAIKLSVKYAGLDENKASQLIDFLKNNFKLPDVSVIPSEEMDILLRQDKKNQNGKIKMVLLQNIGKPVIMQI